MTEKSIRLVAVGDIFLGEHPVTLGHGVATIARRHGCNFLFDKTVKYLAGADIVCGNLEGIISPKNREESGIQKEIFWGNPDCAQAMKVAGFNCLFLANNHTAQHGKNALERTCTLLEKHGIQRTGFNPANPQHPIPAIFHLQGHTVAMLAYCETQQYHLDSPILPIIDFDNIRQDIESVKDQADIVIISLHWGEEFINYPSHDQVDLAHKIIDAGANVILGHHSHTMQGIEKYRHGLIAYSLGSFIKDLWPKKLRESMILSCEIAPSCVKKLKLVPIIIHHKLHRPEFYGGDKGKKFVSYVHGLNKKIDRLSNKNSHMQKYIKDAKMLLLQDRLSTFFHYIFSFHRYDKKRLRENIVLMIKRRLNKKNI